MQLAEALRAIEDADDIRLTVGNAKLHGKLKDGFTMLQDDEDIEDIYYETQ